MRKLWMLGALLVVVGAWAAGQARGPIVIRSDADFTEENGVVGGLGIFGQPYVIAGWKIDAGGEPYGVLIQGTQRPVVIRDVEIQSATVAGVQVQNAKNVTVERVRVKGSAVGVGIIMGQGVQVREVYVEECLDGMRTMFSTGLEIAKVHILRAKVGVWLFSVKNTLLVGSIVEDCELGILVEMYVEEVTIAGNAILRCRIPARSDGGAAWDDGAHGNFWDGFVAPDRNGDGIYDWPFLIGRDEDRFPLVAPPVP